MKRVTSARSYPATIATAVEHEIVIRKSRFLTRIEPVASVEQAEAVIAGIRKRAWDANHNCTAMVTGLLGDQARSSDDGEPSGTAGIPMLEVLRRRDLTDVVAVVTRYFGGVKLGAGGLVRAYSSAVSEALDLASLVRRAVLRQVTLEVPHAEAGATTICCASGRRITARRSATPHTRRWPRSNCGRPKKSSPPGR